MTPADAYLLSPYRPPTSYPVSLDPDEAAAWLAGYFSLWHPAVLARVGRPPRPASAYDHDRPGDGAIYCTPTGPEVFHADDWPNRVHDAGGAEFRATPDRDKTLENLQEALGDSPHWDAPVDLVRAFAGVGYGHLLVDGLFEAADHDRLLDHAGFWADVSRAVAASPADPAAAFAALHAAADTLRVAREQLTPAAFHLLDFAVLTPDKLGAAWPLTLTAGQPVTVQGPAELFGSLAVQHPERFAELKAACPADRPGHVSLATGGYSERDDVLLPLESQWWNLSRGKSRITDLLGVAPETYARTRSAAQQVTPAHLAHCGYKYAVLAATDGADLPGKNAAVLNWPSPDGKTVDAVGRAALPAADPLTFFNLTHTLHAAIGTDSAPLAVFAHRGDAPATGYAELVALADLADAVGAFTTVPRYLGSHHYGEYLGTNTPDDFVIDTLDDRVTARRVPDPVSAFARHQRRRRRVDGALALLALARTLAPPTAADRELLTRVEAAEHALEAHAPDGPDDPETLAALEADAAGVLARLLAARGALGQPGFLVFNPAAVTRRVGLELPGLPGSFPLGGAVKASEHDGTTARAVVEVPGLGFVWLPRPTGPAPAVKVRAKLADGATVRNEFFEAELDPVTGGLRAFRDLRTRQNRLGVQLVYNPGSTSRARSVVVTHSGAALGEVTADGDILSDDGRVLATFRHRLRAWAGRPALEVVIELHPVAPPDGYPWHSYYAARVGWRDERAALYRGVAGSPARTSAPRPGSPDYLETRLGAERTAVFTGGLPFAQKHGARAVDVVLVAPGETASRFELLLAMDRDYPTPTAAGWVTPSPVVAVETGPPNGMMSSSLVHLDLPSLHMTGFRPGHDGQSVVARLIESAGFGGAADLTFPKPPTAAALVDGAGEDITPVTPAGPVVPLEFSAGETVRVRVEWAG